MEKKIITNHSLTATAVSNLAKEDIKEQKLSKLMRNLMQKPLPHNFKWMQTIKPKY